MRLKLAIWATAATLACGGCSLFGGKRQAPQQVNDPTVQASLEAALVQEPMLKDATISVKSEGGVVTLTGSVKSITEKERAGQVATSVSNVAQVRNNLLVRNPTGR